MLFEDVLLLLFGDFELLIGLVRLLYFVHNVPLLGLVEDLMHGIITKISQQETQQIKQNNVTVMIPKMLGLFEGLFDFLLYKQVHLIQILQEGLIQTGLDPQYRVINLL